MITIDIKTQTIVFKDKVYQISTAKNGVGERENSFKTPKGKHIICEKIGKNMPKFTIFKARESVGIWDEKLTKKDLILSRILWLDGIESFNKNSKQRYVYIHGTNDEDNIGKPISKGCIRMKNDDIIEFFELVEVGEIMIIK